MTGSRAHDRSSDRGAVRLYGGVRRVRNKLFSLAIQRGFAAFGDHSVIEMPARLSGTTRIEIGRHVFVGAGSWLQTLTHDEAVGRITIGDGASLQGNCTLSAVDRVELGAEVLMARGVYISDHGHGYGDPERAILNQGLTKIAPVRIGAGAWLGQNVVVGPGVVIGRGAVIGANSVVTSDVPDFAVAVGAPARVIRCYAAGPTSDPML